MKTNRLEKLEAVRGFAALYVVLFHTLPQKILIGGINIGLLFRFGPEAVIVFFALSGFVIQYTYERSKDKSFRYYFVRRFIRLYIPLLFIFLLGYILKCYEAGQLASPEWKTLMGNLFMLQDVISQKPNVITGAYMGNGVLWSLSYEWWFYMLFFVLRRKIAVEKLNKWVSILCITAAASYLFYPFIINRLVMYFAIWWTGVRFASLYLRNEPINFKNIRPHLVLLSVITVILGINLYIHQSASSQYTYPLVAYPFVEFRHFLFSLMVTTGAVLWKKWNWFGFNSLFEVFKHLAPASYVIYISHHYLVVDATYLSFLHNKILEYALYIIVMIAFSFLIEVILYEKIRKKILS